MIYVRTILQRHVGRLSWGELYEWPYNRMADSIIKEIISHYCEATIDHSRVSCQEKEDQKRQMKQSLEVYIQGVKDEMRGMGRMR